MYGEDHGPPYVLDIRVYGYTAACATARKYSGKVMPEGNKWVDDSAQPDEKRWWKVLSTYDSLDAARAAAESYCAFIGFPVGRSFDRMFSLDLRSMPHKLSDPVIPRGTEVKPLWLEK